MGTINSPNTARNKARCLMAIPGAVTTTAGCVHVLTLACVHTFKERGREEGSGGRRTEEQRKEALRRPQWP